MSRDLTIQERKWLEQTFVELIQNGHVDNFILNLRKQIKDLKVVSQCECGSQNCHTIQFQYYEKGKSSVLYMTHIEDGRILLLHVNRENNGIAELEIV